MRADHDDARLDLLSQPRHCRNVFAVPLRLPPDRLAGEGEVRLEHLPQSLTGATAEPARRILGLIPSVTFNVGATLEQAERELIETTLTYTKNNRTRAAEILGINQKTLYNKLKEYGEGPLE